MIIARIRNIEDPQFLSAILMLLESQTPDRLFPLSPEQKAGIARGVENPEQGKTKSHEDFMQELDEWLDSE